MLKPQEPTRKPDAERLLQGCACERMADLEIQIPYEVHKRDCHSRAQVRWVAMLLCDVDGARHGTYDLA